MIVNNHPTVDTKFVVEKILESGKVIPESQSRYGNSITFVLIGDKPMHKRQILFRETQGEISFIQATGLAILYGFMGKLLTWYEINKNWKEGGYVVKPHPISSPNSN